MGTHKTENCLRTADFYCVHGTHRSEFSMRTERKIVRTYAVRIVIYFAVTFVNNMFTALQTLFPFIIYLKKKTVNVSFLQGRCFCDGRQVKF